MSPLIGMVAIVACGPHPASAGGYARRESARATYEASGQAGDVQLGPWHFIGPFDNRGGAGFEAAYPPEQAVDLAASYDGKGSQTVRWQRGDAFRDGQVNSLALFGDNDEITIYLCRTLHVAAAQDLPVVLGSDDTLTVWLNGRELLKHNVTRSCALGDERLILPLQAGDNALLMKVCQGGGPTGFAFALDEGQDSLLARIAQDFPDEIQALLLELDWERQARSKVSGGSMAPENDAPGGCDGVKNGGAGFHTAHEPQPWWLVDLGKSHPLREAVLYNREPCPERNNVLIISLSEDRKTWRRAWQNDGTLFFGAKDGQPLHAPLSGESARYVRLELPGTEYLHLDEVEIYGADDAARNLALNRPATQSSTSLWSTYEPAPAADDQDADRALFHRATLEALDLAGRTLEFVGSAEAAPSAAGDLNRLRARISAAGDDADWEALYRETRRLRRALILSHPLLRVDRLLITKRPPPLYSHMVDQYEGRHSRAGDGLVLLDDWRSAPRETVLFAGKLPRGAVLNPELSFDATRVLFSFCDHTVQDPNARRFFLHELDLQTGDVRQVTGRPGVDPLAGWEGRDTVLIEDFDPCYLPDGDILFISTRNQAFGRCHGGRYTPSYVLYRCKPDGTDIQRLSYSEANEWEPSVLPDGSIIYTRWDYINRINTFFQSLWTTLPDGTAVAHYYKNATRNPCMVNEARSIPGSERIACSATAHHSYTAGSLITVDRGKGEEGLDPVTRLTPEASFPETEAWPIGSYCNPWPLSEDLYLAAYSAYPQASQGNVQQADAYGIYLVDTLGGRELIYRDPTTSCFSPIPVQPRPTPPVVPSSLDPGREDGTFIIQDLYRSVESLERGSVKRIRVVRLYEQPTAAVPPRGAVDQEVVKGVLGTVPVGEDGSVAFRAPAQMPLLFQLLDANDMALFSMRSQVYLQPGETMSCVGCHEPRGTTPTAQATVAGRRVLDIEPPPGARHGGGFSFARSVQPVLDRHCIKCHGLERTEADLTLLGTPTAQFSVAYESLVSRPGLVKLAHPYQETDVSHVKDYGAHAGRLGPLLLTGYREKGRMDREGFARIAEWLDLNGQYYGDYSFSRAERREPNAEGLTALRAHVQQSCGACHPGLADQPFAALANTAAPDESRLLQAHLAEAAGGWGQCGEAWPDRAAAGYLALREKVLAATGPADGLP